MGDRDYEKIIKITKALSDLNRLKIIELLKTGEQCGCKLLDELNIGQSTLSHHMRILTDAKIVRGRKQGKWIHYSLDNEKLEGIKKLLDEVL